MNILNLKKIEKFNDNKFQYLKEKLEYYNKFISTILESIEDISLCDYKTYLRWKENVISNMKISKMYRKQFSSYVREIQE